MAKQEPTAERITAWDAARLAGVELSTMLTWCRSGQLATARMEPVEAGGEVWLIDRAELDEIMSQAKRRPDNKPADSVDRAEHPLRWFAWFTGVTWLLAAALFVSASRAPCTGAPECSAQAYGVGVLIVFIAIVWLIGFFVAFSQWISQD